MSLKLVLLGTTTLAMGACAIPPPMEREAVVCDDAATPDCAPDRKVVVE